MPPPLMSVVVDDDETAGRCEVRHQIEGERPPEHDRALGHLVPLDAIASLGRCELRRIDHPMDHLQTRRHRGPCPSLKA